MKKNLSLCLLFLSKFSKLPKHVVSATNHELHVPSIDENHNDFPKAESSFGIDSKVIEDEYLANVLKYGKEPIKNELFEAQVFLSNAIRSADKQPPSNEWQTLSDSSNVSSLRRRLQEKDSGLEWRIAASIVLAILSAIFSGLTLGLMMLDVVQLRIAMDAGKKIPHCPLAVRDAKRAKRIYYLRKDGNFLLVTLLIANVSVNSAFSIITSVLTSGLIGFLLSTAIITFLGEIVPQAVCSRYGLAIGYYLCPVVLLVEILLYVIIKPVAMFLDWMLEFCDICTLQHLCVSGPDLGNVYNRDQLKALVQHHEKEVKVLKVEEAKLIFGSLDVATKTVRSVMTPLEKMYTVNINSRLDFNTAAEMVASGYSRIPVINPSSPEIFVGLLYTKDIALIDPTLQLPIRSVLSMFGRNLYGVDADAKLLTILEEFKKGHSHMAVVREVVNDSDDKDPYYRHVGVITLEDIIEEILQDEILDEYEQTTNSLTKKKDQEPPEIVKLETETAKSRWRSFCCLHQSVRKDANLCQEAERVLETDLSSGPLELLEGRTTTNGGLSDETTAHTRQMSQMKSNFKGQPAESFVQSFEKVNSPIVSENLVMQRIPEFIKNEKLTAGTSLGKNILDAFINDRSIANKEEAEVLGTMTGSYALKKEDPNSLVKQEENIVKDSSSVEGVCMNEKVKITTPSTNDNVDRMRHAMLGRLRLFDSRRRVEPLSSNEAAAVSLFLSGTFPLFGHPYIDVDTLRRLLEHLSMESPDSSQVLYKRGVPNDSMILILQGWMYVVSGQDDIGSHLGPWNVLGVKALGPPNLRNLTNGLKWKEDIPEEFLSELDQRLQTWSSSFVYSPDFTATPSTHKSHGGQFRYLRVSRSMYIQGLKATILREAKKKESF